MERDNQLELYGSVAFRLKQAYAQVAGLQVPEDVRVQLSRKLLVITAAAKHDLAGAARRLEDLMTDLDEGRFPDQGSG
jgi:antitoxin component of MazEF toxin-antitoxin module